MWRISWERVQNAEEIKRLKIVKMIYLGNKSNVVIIMGVNI